MEKIWHQLIFACFHYHQRDWCVFAVCESGNKELLVVATARSVRQAARVSMWSMPTAQCQLPRRPLNNGKVTFTDSRIASWAALNLPTQQHTPPLSLAFFSYVFHPFGSYRSLQKQVRGKVGQCGGERDEEPWRVRGWGSGSGDEGWMYVTNLPLQTNAGICSCSHAQVSRSSILQFERGPLQHTEIHIFLPVWELVKTSPFYNAQEWHSDILFTCNIM